MENQITLQSDMPCVLSSNCTLYVYLDSQEYPACSTAIIKPTGRTSPSFDDTIWTEKENSEKLQMPSEIRAMIYSHQ